MIIIAFGELVCMIAFRRRRGLTKKVSKPPSAGWHQGSNEVYATAASGFEQEREGQVSNGLFICIPIRSLSPPERLVYQRPGASRFFMISLAFGEQLEFPIFELNRFELITTVMINKSWLRSGYAIRQQNAPHFLTFTVCGWIDLFTRKANRDILIDSLTYCRKHKGLALYAWVIMSNHIHLVVRVRDGFRLSDFVRDFKTHTHRQMIKNIDSPAESRRLWILHQLAYYASRHSRNENYQIWVQENHPVELSHPEMVEGRINYLHDNPVRAGIVRQARDYIYSSATDFAGSPGLLELDPVSDLFLPGEEMPMWLVCKIITPIRSLSPPKRLVYQRTGASYFL